MKLERAKRAKFVERAEDQDDGSIWELLLFTVFFVVVFSAVARADDSASVLSTNVPAVTTASPVKFGATLLLETSSARNDADKEMYSGLYRIDLKALHEPSAISFLTRLEYERQYSYQNDDGTDGQFSNPLFGLTKSLTKTNGLSSDGFFDKIAFGLRASLPGNRTARKQTLQFAVGPMAAFTKSFGKLDVQQTFQYSRRAYEYDMGADGAVNSPDSYRGVTELTWNFTEKFALSGALLYDYSVSFQNVGRASYLSSVSLDYSFLENVAASVGVATQRGTLEADGETNRVLIYDASAASSFLDLILSF